jgi:molecular chaperone HtpG
MGKEEQPVIITQDEFMRRMKEMAQMGGGGMMQFYGQMPDNYTIAVNGNHPLVMDILDNAEKSYGDRLKSINKKISAAENEQNLLLEVIKGKEDKDLSEEERTNRDTLREKVDTLRAERATRLREIGAENMLVKQLIDLALLSNGMLKGENLTSFIRRSVELIGK